MQQIYTLGIYIYYFLVKVYSFFNSKAKKIIEGHVSTWGKIEKLKDDSYVWFHVASLGEFEQGRPLIEALKRDYPEKKILITFFSPSGYQVKKDYKYADLVLYLPFDTPKNAKLFLSKITIEIAVFIKYEFWFNFLSELQSQSIPILYVSSLFRKGQVYFKNSWMVNVLKKVNHFFVQNEESRSILSFNGIYNASVAGDTRIDSVLLTAKEKWTDERFENILDSRPIIVFGSTWKTDHRLIISFINKHSSKYQYIIAPHEINQKEISELEKSIQLKVSLFGVSEEFSDVIIIDSIGVLKYIYRYADLAYIGGGFNKGIHNTLEPLSYGVPVLFGPKNHTKFTEATQVIKNALGALVKKETFHKVIKGYLDSQLERNKAKQNIRKYLQKNKGASSKVLDVISSLLES